MSHNKPKYLAILIIVLVIILVGCGFTIKTITKNQKDPAGTINYTSNQDTSVVESEEELMDALLGDDSIEESVVNVEDKNDEGLIEDKAEEIRPRPPKEEILVATSESDEEDAVVAIETELESDTEAKPETEPEEVTQSTTKPAETTVSQPTTPSQPKPTTPSNPTTPSQPKPTTPSQPTTPSNPQPTTPSHTHTWECIHHPAEYKTVSHPAEYKTVHHDAEYKTVYATEEVPSGWIYTWYKVKCYCGKVFEYSNPNGIGSVSDLLMESHLEYLPAELGLDLSDDDDFEEYITNYFTYHGGYTILDWTQEPIYETQTVEKQELVKEAWDEKVLVKEAWTEQVLVKEAWDEYKCKCGAVKPE